MADEPQPKMLTRRQLETAHRLHPDGKLTQVDAERFTLAERKRVAKVARQARGMAR